MVEEEERLIGRPGLRLRGFRRPRPRPRFRPPSRLRPHLQDNEEKELEEMMAALGENSPLKAEFEKFMKEQLGGGTGPRRLAQLGSGQFQSCVWIIPLSFFYQHLLSKPQIMQLEYTNACMIESLHNVNCRGPFAL